MKYKGRLLSSIPPTANTSGATAMWLLQDEMQGMQSNTWPGLVTPDPYFSSVMLLLHGDGSFTDSSSKNTSITLYNSATTSASTYKFGTGSLNYTASTAYGELSNSNFDFGTNDWTIEMWWYHPASIPAYGVIFDVDSSSKFFVGFSPSTSGLRLYHSSGIDYNPSHSMSAGNWYHLAWVRNGGTVTIYQGGSSIGSVSCTGYNFSPTSGYNYAYLNTYGLNGRPWYQAGSYVDDFRITKGVARYTSNFTPPTAAFPNA